MAGVDESMDDAALRRADFADMIERVAGAADRAAFAALYGHFAPRVKAYLRQLGTTDGSADEIAQEVMLTVWRKAATFDRARASVSTWIFTIARNRRIDVIRREQRPGLDPSDPLLMPDAEPDPGETMDARAREARLHAAIAELPPEQAQLLRLAFFKGLTHAELAVQEGLPLGTVKSRLRLALTRLKKAMGGEG